MYDSNDSRAPSKPTRARRLWNEWAKPILLAVVILSTFRSAVADWNDVPTPSMVPTILEGDRVFIDKRAYDWRVPFVHWRIVERNEPERGDIVIFPSPLDGRRLIKRIVGTPGDVLEMKDRRLFVNGEAVVYSNETADLVAAVPDGEVGAGRRVVREELGDRPHAVMLTRASHAPASFEPLTVPPARYFMMGDNRDDSLDSRTFGTIPRDHIHGKALGVAISVDPDRYYLPRWARFFTRLP